jgi:hypothetical protein
MTIRSDHGQTILETTLLELVSVMTSVEKSDETVVAQIVELVRGGWVKLTGNFREVPVERLFAA